MTDIRLGLRANAAQFSLLVGLNALVGAMVGLERSVLPLVGQQRVDERRAETEQGRGRECRPKRPAAGDEQGERAGLDQHPRRDQWLAADAVGEPAGDELEEPQTPG